MTRTAYLGHTHEGFIARMGPHVNIQVRFLRKVLPAVWKGAGVFAFLSGSSRRLLEHDGGTWIRDLGLGYCVRLG